MKFVIQRVQEASVAVDQICIGQIQKGFLVLIGIGKDDTREIADQLIKKMIQLRIFEDENGKTNLALKDVGGSLLLVSQQLRRWPMHYMNTLFLNAGNRSHV